MFRRRGRESADDAELGSEDEVGQEPKDAASAHLKTAEAPAERANGPWDETEVDKPLEGRVDLGGLLVPAVPGMEVRLEVSEQQQVMAITVVLGQSAIQLQGFAAPRSEGIWGEVRDEISAEVTKQGGVIDKGVGAFGPELRARVPVRLPDGNQGVQVVRFLGADGPRWFLRAVISGQAAIQPQAAAVVEQVFRDVVVVRGTQAMAPRDPIPLRLPPQAMPTDPAAAAGEQAPPVSPYSGQGLSPFERGPEITEIR
ncbi:DUF3710 domain-containing protein [Actinospica sp.]|jgi:hypothetical protein|uniref:DUF3710 domain-containing protein n=1 Tax=Actinospica sp. TaxID=1872142 RepID=UPI002BF03D7A|nr:DUF3710 domain-containing protein [Actinospica sp.]HWG23072.1 DUF3710 domain-containing protein [Actinospica sp.]